MIKNYTCFINTLVLLLCTVGFINYTASGFLLKFIQYTLNFIFLSGNLFKKVYFCWINFRQTRKNLRSYFSIHCKTAKKIVWNQSGILTSAVNKLWNCDSAAWKIFFQFFFVIDFHGVSSFGIWKLCGRASEIQFHY